MIFVGRHVSSKLRNGNVVVVEEIRLSLKSRLGAFLVSLLQDAVVDLAMKRKSVGGQAIVDILRNGERVDLPLVVLDIVEDDVFAMLDDQLYDHAFDLRGLRLWGDW